MFIYNSEKDPLERGIINLSIAQIVYNEEQIEMLQVRVISALTFDFVFLIIFDDISKEKTSKRIISTIKLFIRTYSQAFGT